MIDGELGNDVMGNGTLDGRGRACSSTGKTFGRRLFLGGLAGAAGVGALAGCNPGSASGGSAGGSSGKQLSMLLLGASDATVTYVNKTAIPAFSDSSGIKVEVQQSDWGSGFQKVVTAAASGTLPDLVMLGGIWTAPLASKGTLLSLDALLADYADKDAFYPAALADCKYQGKTYALPLYSDTRTAMYRKDILAKAGVDATKLPENWDDYLALARKLAKANGGPLAYPADWGLDKSVGLQQSFAQLILQAGGTYYSSDGKAQFASAEGARALQYLTSFYRDKLASTSMVNSGTGASPFIRGDSAMSFSGLGAYSNAEQNMPAVVKDIVVGKPLASKAGGKPVTCAWINKVGISAKTKNRDGAWQLLQHLTSKTVAAKMGELYGGLPARKDLADAAYLKGISPNLVQATQYVIPQPPNANMLTIAPQINTALEQAIRLDGSPMKILTTLDATIDQINGV